MFPCPVKNCHYRGYGQMLKVHLMSNIHKWEMKEASFQTSLYLRIFKYTCRIMKAGNTRPTLCTMCYLVVKRIDQHLQSAHQLRTSLSVEDFRKKYKAMQKATYMYFKKPIIEPILFGRFSSDC